MQLCRLKSRRLTILPAAMVFSRMMILILCYSLGAASSLRTQSAKGFDLEEFTGDAAYVVQDDGHDIVKIK